MIPLAQLGLPWTILPAAAEAEIQAPRNRADDQVGHPVLSQVSVIGSVAVVPIVGVIGKGMSEMQEYYWDECNLHRIDRQLENIAADSSISTVVFAMGTPGGVSIGVETTARKIRNLALAGKKTVAYTDTLCASAGYWLASACNRIIANPSAILGSISTITVAYDYTERFAQMGIQVKVFRTGELKGAGTMGKPWTPEEEAAVERRMQHIDGVFKNFVAAQRPALDPAQMNGDYWYAADAPVGLIDATADSIEDVISSLL